MICEFCNKEADTQGTSMTGAYCVDCLKLTIAECRDAIKQIKERNLGKSRVKAKPITEEEYNQTLQRLMNPPDLNR